MIVYKTTTGTSAPSAVALPGTSMLYGVIATYAESATYFIKFWWQGNSNVAPTVGVTKPSLTIPISSGGPGYVLAIPIVMEGPLYWAATTNASDTDATALGTGGDVVNILLG